MTRTIGLAGVVACLGVLTAPPAAHGQTVIALSGGAAPGGGSYGYFSAALLNNSGQVAFAATLAGGTARVGVFAGAAGALQSVARGGDAAPGGGTYLNPTSDILSDAFGLPNLNAAGQVAFQANTTAGSGVYAGAAGSVQAVALSGQSAPGTGSTFSGFAGIPTLSPGGQAVFTATVTGGSAPTGVFAGTAGGAVRAVALQGQTPAGPVAGSFFSFGTVSQDAAGQVGVYARLSTNGTSATAGGYYAESGGQLRAVAVGGQPAPAGGNYAALPQTGVQGLAVAGNGQLAFGAALSGGSATAGFFAGTATSVQAVALEGQAAPGGGTYTGLENGRIAVNASGQVAFATTGGGVYAGQPGAIQALAVAGQPAPGGGTFSGVPYTPLLNAAGQVAFADNNVLYGWTNGSLSRLVAVGDVINVASGGTDNRTVDSFDIVAPFTTRSGRFQALSDTGLLVVEIYFTDGSSGVFTYQLVPVPEPATVGLAAVAGLGLVRLARRRGRCSGVK